MAVVRTQIQLTEEQMRFLRMVASRDKVPIAEVVRRYVDRAMADEKPGRREQYARASKLAGAFEDPEGATDLSSEHDSYLGETGR
ncbi:MAG: CopG family transcriptional regulator [Deltaproteobacteria bacterium]|nr:CopG family transcriptional regulator [Deltaproteobacteria bacterium]